MVPSYRSLPLAILCLLASCPLCLCGESLGLRVPPGFQVTEFADNRLANDIYCMTLDPRGRVVVSGRGYIRILVDDDGDGRADRAIDLADAPKDGAQGLLWEGDSLYVVGDGRLCRYHVVNDRVDGAPELIRAVKTGGEHDAHALRRGPDGWLYLVCGNNTGINRRFAQLPTSPITEPVAGCVVRFTPDLKQSEVVADGFRNPYGMDFNPDGELFTFDSDNERCVSLPWYEPTRFYHVIPGGHYGWQAPQHADFWRWPPYFADVVAPVATLGRGSPTGVVCYRHTQFPPAYRGGFFLCDWTFGRIYFMRLHRSGSSYTAEREVFLQSVGDNGFAPTALAVHPVTGDLYVTIGGRGTRGAVYRIRYRNGADPAGLAKLRPEPRSLRWNAGLHDELLAKARGGDAFERLRALTLIRRYHKAFLPAELRGVFFQNAGHADRNVRRAAADLLALRVSDLPTSRFQGIDTPLKQAVAALALSHADPAAALERALVLAASKGADAAEKRNPFAGPGPLRWPPDVPPGAEVGVRLTAVRAVQEALGGLTAREARGTVWEGYSPRRPVEPKERLRVSARLAPAFPSGDANLDRELSRTLAMIEDDTADLPARVVMQIDAKSDPIEDVHYLIVLSRLRGPRSSDLTRRTAAALLALDRKLTERHDNRDTNWPLRIAELHAELARKDPALNAALLADPAFGRPDHALFARCPGFDRRRAAEVFLARAAKDDEYPWSAELVGLLGSLPAKRSLPVLRRLWERGGLEDAILPLLARHPEAVDWAKYLRGLESPQLATLRLCLDALEKLPASNDGSSVLALVRALRRLPEGKQENAVRGQLAGYLRQLTGQKLGADRDAWVAWFRRAHPDLAARLGNSDGVDVAGWERRLAALDWAQGEAERGRAVFAKASCAACHSGSQALGPDLRGVTNRFSRADLFTAILQPSKDVSPRYRTTQVATPEGKVYQGLIIYEAVDGLILQTGPATTVRVGADHIAERRLTDVSLMPVGLLDRLPDRDIADLYAYLRSLGNGAAPGPKPKGTTTAKGRG